MLSPLIVSVVVIVLEKVDLRVLDSLYERGRGQVKYKELLVLSSGLEIPTRISAHKITESNQRHNSILTSFSVSSSHKTIRILSSLTAFLTKSYIFIYTQSVMSDQPYQQRLPAYNAVPTADRYFSKKNKSKAERPKGSYDL